MIALIDSDTPAYAAAAMAEGQSEQIARWNVNKTIEDILRKVGTDQFQCFVTGNTNFRYQVYPEYKANRLKVKRPEYLQVCKQHLIDEWGAVESINCEADDLLGIELTRYNAEDIPAILVSIDKDLDQIPGLHYNPRKELQYTVTPLDGLRFFYYQLLVGDTADNIKGASGIGPKRAEKILAGLNTEWELYNAVKDFFSCEEELVMNAKCLYIWKKENDEWSIPIAV